MLLLGPLQITSDRTLSAGGASSSALAGGPIVNYTFAPQTLVASGVVVPTHSGAPFLFNVGSAQTLSGGGILMTALAGWTELNPAITVGEPMSGPATVKPAIAFPVIGGVFLPAVPAPDTSSTDAVFQMTVTEYNPPSTKPKLNTTATLPLVNGDTMYGGTALLEAAIELKKITLSGYFDTPCVQVGSWRLPDVFIPSTGARITYADYIILCNEGRITKPWKRIDPLWFRDPHGRVYTNPRVLDFTATYAEGIPGRTNFQLTLVV